MEKPQKKWKKYVKAKKKVRRLLRHENCEKRASGFLRFANMVEYEDKHQVSEVTRFMLFFFVITA